MSREAILPGYAKALENGRITVDAEKFYPELLAELWADENWPEPVVNEEAEGVPAVPELPKMYQGLQRGEIDQYWLEVAFACMKLDIQRAVAGTVLMPKRGAAVILVQDATKKVDDEGNVAPSKWALKIHPKGRGANAAVQGREAREHYKRIRGGLI